MTGMTTASGTRRSFVRTAAAALVAGMVPVAGCSAPADGTAAPADAPDCVIPPGMRQRVRGYGKPCASAASSFASCP